MKKYPNTWFIPSNTVYQITQDICAAVTKSNPETKGWQHEVLKIVDGFLEENSFDLNEVTREEIDKCLKIYMNSQA